MSIKKITTLILALVILVSCFSACSNTTENDSTDADSVVEVYDEDDKEDVVVENDEDTTLCVTDSDGYILTIVPIYDIDGVTVVAGYVESATDSDGKELSSEEYEYIKSVVSITVNDDSTVGLNYNDDGGIITIDAKSDENGYIVAMQDSMDLDSDKNVEEYFQVETKLDSSSNLFIKISKNDDGTRIEVTVVENEQTGEQQIVNESTGETQTVVNTKNAVNLSQVVEKDKESKSTSTTTDKTTTTSSSSNSKTTTKSSSDSGTTKSSSNSNSSNSNSDTSTTSGTTTTEEAPTSVTIVLQNNGKVSYNAGAITVNEASAINGGTEVVVDVTASNYTQYYVTSDTNNFSGQIEFRLDVDDDINVKFYNVTMSTSKKTAVKFTNVASEVTKESDSEEVGNGTADTTTNIAAPSVSLSITGDNSFKATGSGTNGTIYSECKLAIKGHGTATIDGGTSLSGICSTESITIKNATLNITSEAKQGISCDKKLTVESGATITTSTKGDGFHCNKFEYDGDDTSSIIIKSLNSTNCADGIDSDKEVIINGGYIYVEALSTDSTNEKNPYKRGIKVRNIENEKGGVFAINGGTVEICGASNTAPSDSTQDVVCINSKSGGDYTYIVGDVTSTVACRSFICSPVDRTSVTSVGSQESTTTRKLSWRDGRYCMAVAY